MKITTFEPSEENKKIISEYIKYYKARNPDKNTRNIKASLRALAHSLNKKSLKKATEQDLINFFNAYKKPSSRSLRANHIIPFYRRIYNIPAHTKNRPPNMYWFKFPTAQEKRRNFDINAKEKYLIETEDYKKMLTWEYDKYGQTQALWETYYLTGARPSEITKVKLKDVKKDEQGRITMTVKDSKSQPRNLLFPTTPFKLLEYIENHPYKDNPNAYLWFALNRPSKTKSINDNTIRKRFKKMKSDLKLKPTLILKSFRKTRATKVFTQNELEPDEIGDIFGWEPHTVIMRKKEYKLTNQDDLKAKYCKNIESQPSYKQVIKKQETTDKKVIKDIEKLNKYNENLQLEQEELRSTIDDLSQTIADLVNPTKQDLESHIPISTITKVSSNPDKYKFYYWDKEKQKRQTCGESFELENIGLSIPTKEYEKIYYETSKKVNKFLISKLYKQTSTSRAKKHS